MPRELDRLNVYPVPDGDTGTNMARTLDAVVTEMEAVPAELVATCRAVAHGSLMGARGNSGVILSQILRGLTSTFEQAVDVGPRAVASALSSASAAAYEAVLRPVEGTILTVVREAAARRVQRRRCGRHAGRRPGRGQPARRTRRCSRRRSCCRSSRTRAWSTPAAPGSCCCSTPRSTSWTARPLPPAPAVDDVAPDPRPVAPRDTPVGDLRYEVMYFLDLVDAEIGRFKEAWGRIGDSIVVVGGDGLWNCHVHTDDIGAAIEVALTAGGRPWQIRVTDLHDEAAAEHDVREEAMRRPRTCGVVAVADGTGLVELLGRLGVQEVVVGGQTMNPSTAELLEAVERVAAGQVVLLPANGNILPVAEQAAALTGKVARVVPACSIPEALAALVAYEPDREAGENAERMAGGHGRRGRG